jgi:hypothetical protein
MSLQQEQQIRDLLAVVATMIARIQLPTGIEGVAVAGSWDPNASSAFALRGDSYASPTEQQVLINRNVSVATTAWGDQYGVQGGERTIVIPTQSGGVLLFEHGEDDSPQAPSGWRYISKIVGLKIFTKGGLVIQIDDTSGEVQLGAIGLNSTQDAVITQTHLQSAIEGLRSAVQTAITTLARECQGGSGVAPPTISDVTTAGSSKVKAAP